MAITTSEQDKTARILIDAQKAWVKASKGMGQKLPDFMADPAFMVFAGEMESNLQRKPVENGASDSYRGTLQLSIIPGKGAFADESIRKKVAEKLNEAGIDGGGWTAQSVKDKYLDPRVQAFGMLECVKYYGEMKSRSGRSSSFDAMESNKAMTTDDKIILGYMLHNLPGGAQSIARNFQSGQPLVDLFPDEWGKFITSNPRVYNGGKLTAHGTVDRLEASVLDPLKQRFAHLTQPTTIA
jgi:hypothetical protein